MSPGEQNRAWLRTIALYLYIFYKKLLFSLQLVSSIYLDCMNFQNSIYLLLSFILINNIKLITYIHRILFCRKQGTYFTNGNFLLKFYTKNINFKTR